MENRYLYAPAWTELEDHVEVTTNLAFTSCALLDIDDRVVWFDRNLTTLSYTLGGEERELTPQLKFTVEDQNAYLYSFESGAVSQTAMNVLKAKYNIYFWSERTILSEPRLTNIKLLRRHFNGTLFTDFVTLTQKCDYYLSESNTLTPRWLSLFNGCSIEEASEDLLKLAANKLLQFDLEEVFTESTQFNPPTTVNV